MNSRDLYVPEHVITVADPNELFLNLDTQDDQAIYAFMLGAKLYEEQCPAPELTAEPSEYPLQDELVDAEPSEYPLQDELVEPVLRSEEKGKFGAFKSAVKEDFDASENRWATAGWATGMAVGQVFDRFRGSVILTPTLATAVMEHTQNSVLTGAVASATFFIVNKFIGESLNYGLDEFPTSVETFNEEFPGIVGAFTDSLAGIDDKNTHDAKRQEQVARPPALKRLRGHIEQVKSDVNADGVETVIDKSKVVGKHLLNLAKVSIHSIKANASVNRKRALTCIGIGPTPFVATAAANGYTRKERSKVTNATVGATSAFVGTLGFGLSESVIQLAEHGHQEAALDIQNIVSSTWVWLGFAALSMGSEFVSNRYEKRKQASKEAS